MRTAKAAKTKAEIKATITGKIKKVIAASIVAVTLATSISLSPVANTAITAEAKCPTTGHTKKVTMKPLYIEYTKQGGAIEIGLMDTSTIKKLDTIIKECGITANTIEYDAVDKIHTWICTNIVYDYDAISNQEPKETLKFRKAQCVGYAKLFTAFCDRLGVKSTQVVSKTHAWNLVQIDNVWYHIDTCWDAGLQSKEYFLLSESEIQQETTSHIIKEIYDRIIYTDYKITYKLNGGKNNKKNRIKEYRSETSILTGKVSLETKNALIYGFDLKANSKFYSPKKAGYTFKGWYYKGKKVTKLKQIMFKEKNVALTAKWSKVKRPTVSSKNFKITTEKFNSYNPGLGIIKVKVKGTSTYYNWKIINKATNEVCLCANNEDNLSSGVSRMVVETGSYKVIVRAYRKDSTGKKIYSKSTKTYNIQVP